MAGKYQWVHSKWTKTLSFIITGQTFPLILHVVYHHWPGPLNIKVGCMSPTMQNEFPCFEHFWSVMLFFRSLPAFSATGEVTALEFPYLSLGTEWYTSATAFFYPFRATTPRCFYWGHHSRTPSIHLLLFHLNLVSNVPHFCTSLLWLHLLG